MKAWRRSGGIGPAHTVGAGSPPVAPDEVVLSAAEGFLLSIDWVPAGPAPDTWDYQLDEGGGDFSSPLISDTVDGNESSVLIEDPDPLDAMVARVRGTNEFGSSAWVVSNTLPPPRV